MKKRIITYILTTALAFTIVALAVGGTTEAPAGAADDDELADRNIVVPVGPYPTSIMETQNIYSVKVNGIPVFVHDYPENDNPPLGNAIDIRNHPEHGRRTGQFFSYVQFSFAGEANIEVTFTDDNVTGYTLSPERYFRENIERSGLDNGYHNGSNIRTVSFTLTEPRKLILHEVLGNAGVDICKNLIILAESLESNVPRISDPRVVNVLDFGVVNDGSAYVSDRINEIIQTQFDDGSGKTLYFPAGTYWIDSSIRLDKTNMTVYLAQGAEIVVGYFREGRTQAQLAQSPWSISDMRCGRSGGPAYSVFYTIADNVTIRGRGQINDRGHLLLFREGGGNNGFGLNVNVGTFRWNCIILVDGADNFVVEDILSWDPAFASGVWGWHTGGDSWTINNFKTISNHSTASSEYVSIDSNNWLTIDNAFSIATDDFGNIQSDTKPTTNIYWTNFMQYNVTGTGGGMVGSTNAIHPVDTIVWENGDLLGSPNIVRVMATRGGQLSNYNYNNIHAEQRVSDSYPIQLRARRASPSNVGSVAVHDFINPYSNLSHFNFNNFYIYRNAGSGPGNTAGHGMLTMYGLLPGETEPGPTTGSQISNLNFNNAFIYGVPVSESMVRQWSFVDHAQANFGTVQNPLNLPVGSIDGQNNPPYETYTYSQNRTTLVDIKADTVWGTKLDRSPMIFTVTRSAREGNFNRFIAPCVENDLTVFFRVEGNAVYGIDYEISGAEHLDLSDPSTPVFDRMRALVGDSIIKAVIPAGETSAQITITTLDLRSDITKQVVLVVQHDRQQGKTYLINTNHIAMINIEDRKPDPNIVIPVEKYLSDIDSVNIYDVKVNGIPVFVHDHPEWSNAPNSEYFSYAQFSFAGTANVEISFREVPNARRGPVGGTVTGYTLSPQRYDIHVTEDKDASGNIQKISFTMNEPRKLILHEVLNAAGIDVEMNLILIAESLEESIPERANPNVVYVGDYDVDNTGMTDASLALNKLIESEVPEGGILYISRGSYLMNGPLRPKSNMTVYIAQDAELVVGRLSDHRISTDTAHTVIILHGVDEPLENITIRGRGRINGNGHLARNHQLGGSWLWNATILMENANNLVIEDILSFNPGGAGGIWSQPDGGDDWMIYNMKVIGNIGQANTDGFDFDGNNRAIVDNSFVKATDDWGNIQSQFKDTKNIFMTNIVNYNNGAGGGLVGGTNGIHAIENIVWENADIISAPQAIRVMSFQGGQYRSYFFNNVHTEKVTGGYTYSNTGYTRHNVDSQPILLRARLGTGWWGDGYQRRPNLTPPPHNLPYGNLSGFNFNDFYVNSFGRDVNRSIVTSHNEFSRVTGLNFNNAYILNDPITRELMGTWNTVDANASFGSVGGQDWNDYASFSFTSQRSTLVDIVADDIWGSKENSKPMTFTVTRTGRIGRDIVNADLSRDLVVNYRIRGNAVMGVDYDLPGAGNVASDYISPGGDILRTVTIPAGQDSVQITVVPGKTFRTGDPKQIVVVIQHDGNYGADYFINSNYIAMVNIEDEDTGGSALSGNAMLELLSFMGSSLDPSFDRGVTTYEVTANRFAAGFTITAKAQEAGARVIIGTALADSNDRAIVANTGDDQQIVRVTVVAPNGTSRVYTIIVHKESGLAGSFRVDVTGKDENGSTVTGADGLKTVEVILDNRSNELRSVVVMVVVNDSNGTVVDSTHVKQMVEGGTSVKVDIDVDGLPERGFVEVFVLSNLDIDDEDGLVPLSESVSFTD